MIEQKYTITRTRATWKPRVTDADMPFFTDKDGNTLVALSGDADAVYTGTGRTLVENPPTRILTMPSNPTTTPLISSKSKTCPKALNSITRSAAASATMPCTSNGRLPTNENTKSPGLL